MPDVLNDRSVSRASATNNEWLSIREVADILEKSRYQVLVACALGGIIPREIGRAYAVRAQDVPLLKNQLERGRDEPVPAA